MRRPAVFKHFGQQETKTRLVQNQKTKTSKSVYIHRARVQLGSSIDC